MLKELSIKEQYKLFVETCNKLFGIKEDYIKETVDYLKKTVYSHKNNTGKNKEVDLWYENLKNNIIDYSVYKDKFYLIEAWMSYKFWSRSYINRIAKQTEFVNFLKNYKTICDLGNGIGFSTILLSDIFQDQLITGTNFKDSDQMKFCKSLVTNIKNIKLEDNIENLGKQDILFASEYFEHFQDPICHINQLIEICDPEVIIMANAFNVRALGHFDEYLDCYNAQNKINYTKYNKYFLNNLRSKGYRKYDKKMFFNDRPSVYVKIN